MIFKSYNDALNALPAEAKWSSSFGYPGQGGFAEYFRDKAGNRYRISNGSWHGPAEWKLEKVEE